MALSQRFEAAQVEAAELDVAALLLGLLGLVSFVSFVGFVGFVLPSRLGLLQRLLEVHQGRAPLVLAPVLVTTKLLVTNAEVTQRYRLPQAVALARRLEVFVVALERLGPLAQSFSLFAPPVPLSRRQGRLGGGGRFVVVHGPVGARLLRSQERRAFFLGSDVHAVLVLVRGWGIQ